jgi:hypothetical protein
MVEKDYIENKTIFTFWTGTNYMSETRIRNLLNIANVSQCTVILVTPTNLHDYIKPEHLHPAYQYLSETHKADYLRTYFMYHYGGGYSDIKQQAGSWLPAFECMNDYPEYYICGYPESGEGDIAGTVEIRKQWRNLVGNCAYICRPKTPFTTKWYEKMVKLLDDKLEVLKQHPASFPQDCAEQGSGYPIEWNEMLGRIFHRVLCEFKDKIIKLIPRLIFNNYR